MPGPLDLQARWYLETLPLDGETIVDLGANVGVLSEFFALARDGRSRVLSVEPLEENALQIDGRIQRARAHDRWTVARCAVSSRDGSVLLRVEPGEETALNSVVAQGPPRPGWRSAPAKTLDALCPDATVVKLDIEGHEYDVLDHALPRMRSVKAWAIELHMTEGRPLNATVSALRARGYTVLGAGRKRSDPTGPWVSAEVPPGLEWQHIPAAATRPDGSVFKMLHVVAVRSG